MIHFDTTHLSGPISAIISAQVSTETGVQTGVRIDFPKPLTGVGEIRPVVVQMHHDAHAKLGVVYKLTSGYHLSWL